MEPEVYRASEFCQRYAMSRTTLWREVTANRLRIIKRGGRIFITRSEAECWFRNQHQLIDAGTLAAPTDNEILPKA